MIKVNTKNKIPLTQTTLPWNDRDVFTTGNLFKHLEKALPENIKYHLPKNITIYSDLSISPQAIGDLIEEIMIFLEKEFYNREIRIDKFIDLGLFSKAEIFSLLTDFNNVQPWAIYYSENGGLNQLNKEKENESGYGVIPCSGKPNHGVAWEKMNSVKYKTILATSQEFGVGIESGWDFDSDIGHESAHASFGVIPAFVKGYGPHLNTTPLSSMNNIASLTEEHLAGMCYLYIEISVVTLRGEQRKTFTGLPNLNESKELKAFLKLSSDLFPNIGFCRALDAYENFKSEWVDIDGDEAYYIGAAAMRVIPYIAKMVERISFSVEEWNGLAKVENTLH